jgi:hypothetical protein
VDTDRYITIKRGQRNVAKELQVVKSSEHTDRPGRDSILTVMRPSSETDGEMRAAT